MNHDDDTSFERIVNVPTSGIGNRTLDIVRQNARSNSQTMWRSASDLIQGGDLTARAANALRSFLELIDALSTQMAELELFEQVEQVLGETELLAFHGNAKGEKAETRVENLKELVTAARNYYQDEEENYCEILGNAYIFNVSDQDYPGEWMYDEDGAPCCTQYLHDSEKPIPRCTRTEDMFGG